MPIPAFTDFSPHHIKWQHEAHRDIYNFDYSTGVLESFFSGGVGSAKTVEHIHELVADMIEQPGSAALMVRRALKDLKRTSWAELLSHIRDVPHLIKSYNKSELKITFVNGSTILGDSYDDGDETKFQSLNLSHLDIEEMDEMPQNIYTALKLRVGRAGVPKNRIQGRCNPQSPAHWLYKYFIGDRDHPNKRVHYSLTEHNPFLPPWYVENLRRDLDPKMARRKLYGEWIEINNEMIYHAYSAEKNYRRKEVYQLDPKHPICLMHDFNIGHGKPMSAAVGQYINGVFHIKKTYLVHGFNTEQMLEEIAADGVFEFNTDFYVYGDATGRHRDTRSNLSDWDIIEQFLSKYRRKDKDKTRLKYSIEVPSSNPEIRARHNRMNAYFKNDLGEVRILLYAEADDADEGFRLTKLKKGSVFQEDDSFEKQHVTTAIGYWIYEVTENGLGSYVVNI